MSAPMLRPSWWAVLAVLVMLTPGTGAALLEPGREAPDFSLATLDGRTVTLSELRGKPVVIEFWASWCRPCRRQLPAMAELHHRYESRGIHFLLVNTAEEEATVRRFLERVKVSGTVLLDPDDRVGELYGTEILPSLFVLDGDGRIQAAEAGTITDLAAFMERELGPAPAAGDSAHP